MTRPLFSSVAFFLLATLCVAHANAAKPVFVKPEDVDWQTLLQGPPAVGSDESKSEIDTLLQWQSKRTATDVARCKSEVEVTPFIFSDVLGDGFKQESLPLTADLLDKAQSDIKNITRQVKAHWPRVRPPLADPRIHPCVPLEDTSSYPSAHAVRGIVWGSILGELFPDQKKDLLDRGRLMGEDRVIAGMHFPSDVAAGQKLGEAIFKKMMDSPDFKFAMEQAKKECAKKPA